MLPIFTPAAFASAAQAHGRDIGVRRATGASPRRVLGAVLRDALRIALPATAVGTALALAAFQVDAGIERYFEQAGIWCVWATLVASVGSGLSYVLKTKKALEEASG